MEKGQWKTETVSSHIPRNNYLLEKSPDRLENRTKDLLINKQDRYHLTRVWKIFLQKIKYLYVEATLNHVFK